jgi:hypothetical protein
MEQWPEADRLAHNAAYERQKEIYGNAYAEHIMKYYGGKEPKMIRPMRTLLLIFGKSRK